MYCSVSLPISEALSTAFQNRPHSSFHDGCLYRHLARLCNRVFIFYLRHYSTSKPELIQIYFCSLTAEFDSRLNVKQTAEVIFANPFLFTTSSLVVLADVTAHGDLEWESEGESGNGERGVVIIWPE